MKDSNEKSSVENSENKSIRHDGNKNLKDSNEDQGKEKQKDNNRDLATNSSKSLSTPIKRALANDDPELIGGMQVGSKKVKQPFKSPFRSSPGTPSNNNNNNNNPVKNNNSTPIKKSYLPYTPNSSLRKGKSSQFKSPLIKSSSSPLGSGNSPNEKPSVLLHSEIEKLEKKLSCIRQAIRYKKLDKENDPIESVSQLKALCDKWKEAGRESTEMLWKISGSSDIDTSDPTFKEQTRKALDPNRSTSYFWGWEEENKNKEQKEKEQEAENWSDNGSAGENNEEKETEIQWNMGTMIRLHGLDPKLFGWNDREEDWDS